MVKKADTVILLCVNVQVCFLFVLMSGVYFTFKEFEIIFDFDSIGKD